MFVYINVIENLTSYFGVCNMDFFLKNFEHFIVAFSAMHNTLIFSFCTFSVYQMHGRLPYQKVNGVTKFPFMMAFSVITLYALS